MGIGNPPSVFVSSTCFNLAQVRQDLRIFIESLGMQPVLSEFSSFPVDPSLDAVGNCLARVKDKADIFVLVVGGRYGSEVEGGKSVTNLEYLEAKAKGIPRYVFVQKQIQMALAIWQKNRAGDFSDVVDSPKLFEFVESLRDPKENWIFSFESAQDITDILRKQLAYLFADALTIRAQVARSGIPDTLRDLSGAALLLAVQKPLAWEFRLFGQVLTDEISGAAKLRKDLDYGIVFGSGFRLWDTHQVRNWAATKLREALSLALASDKLVNVALYRAVGEPGEPGDVEEIVYVGQRLGQVYRSYLEWSADLRRAYVDKRFDRLLDIVSRVSRDAIADIEKYSSTLQQRISDAINQYETTGEVSSLDIRLALTRPDMSDLQEEIERIARIAGPGQG